jgi:apolipoprotein N-acyltransferase
MEPYQQAATRLSYSYISDQTWYTMHGDWFAWGCLIAALIFVFAAQIPVYKT